MSHNCSTVLIKCIDFRLAGAYFEFLDKLGLTNDCDIISIAGACKPISSPDNESERDFIFKQLDISVGLHSVKKVIITNHADCGAYGGAGKFSKREDEKKMHADEMHDAEKRIKERYPQIEVEKYYVELVEDKWKFEKVR